MALADIRTALESLTYPVTVVSVGRGGVENALTVSWIAQASFEPPMVMFSVDQRHYSEELLRSTKNCVVNVLGDNQVKLAGQFAHQAMSGEDKFAGVATRESDTGGRILTEALAWLDCEVKALHPAGDHVVVIARVLDGGVQRPGTALTTASGIRYRK